VEKFKGKGNTEGAILCTSKITEFHRKVEQEVNICLLNRCCNIIYPQLKGKQENKKLR